jgi:hypothetical protein
MFNSALLKQMVASLAKVIIRACRTRLAGKAQAHDGRGATSVAPVPNVHRHISAQRHAADPRKPDDVKFETYRLNYVWQAMNDHTGRSICHRIVVDQSMDYACERHARCHRQRK